MITTVVAIITEADHISLNARNVRQVEVGNHLNTTQFDTDVHRLF